MLCVLLQFSHFLIFVNQPHKLFLSNFLALLTFASTISFQLCTFLYHIDDLPPNFYLHQSLTTTSIILTYHIKSKISLRKVDFPFFYFSQPKSIVPPEHTLSPRVKTFLTINQKGRNMGQGKVFLRYHLYV